MLQEMPYPAGLPLGRGTRTHARGTGLFCHLPYWLRARYMKSHDCLSKPVLGEVDKDRMDMNFIINW